MRLAHDMTEMRISSEGRRFIEDRFSHGGAHRVTCLVVPRFKVFTDFRVRDLLEASGTEAAVREQGRQLKQGEAVCGENVERVPQEFVGTRSEMIERPALAKNLGEVTDATKVRRFRFQRVESHGDDCISRINEYQSVAQMLLRLSFVGIDRPQQERSRIAVEIEV